MSNVLNNCLHYVFEDRVQLVSYVILQSYFIPATAEKNKKITLNPSE